MRGKSPAKPKPRRAATRAVTKPARKPKAATKLGRPQSAKAASRARQAATAPKARETAAVPSSPSSPEPQAPPPPKKPGFYEAIAIYETGVRALQRHDFSAGAEAFRQVLDRYPGERELVERARLFLRVCERETAQRPEGPQTTAERVYAATMSLSAGDSDAALTHVQQALEHEPTSHRAHYMMAVIRSTRSENAMALEHLRRAIELNPENRALARQDADLDRLRQSPSVRALLDGAPEESRARTRSRRPSTRV